MKSNKLSKPQSAAGGDAMSINSEGRVCSQSAADRKAMSFAVEGRICCQKCVYFKDNNCTHLTNKGVVIQYRKEKEAFLKSVDELNKDGNCKNYAGS